MSVAPTQFLIAGVRRSYRAIPLSLIRELITVEETVPIPLSPRAVVGMMQLRGSALALLDIFSVADRAQTVLNCPALVMEVGGIQFGILVDEVVQAFTATDDRLLKIHGSESDAEALHWSESQSLAKVVDETKLSEQCQAVRSWFFASI